MIDPKEDTLPSPVVSRGLGVSLGIAELAAGVDRPLSLHILRLLLWKDLERQGRLPLSASPV
jgi:hypothetical protein